AGNICPDSEACLAQSANRADGRHVVKGKKTRERLAGNQEPLGGMIARFRRGIILRKLGDELRIQLEPKPGGSLDDALPSDLRVRTERLTLDYGDAPMA